MNTDQFVLTQLRPINAIESPLPLEHTAVHVRAAGLAATVTVQQRFRNPLSEKADLEYLFPLPHEAAVTSLELRMGERIIRATIQEIEKARKEFEKARKQGKQAGLLESHRPNLFSLQLANIQPGEFITAVLTYHQRLEFNSGRAEFVFPMGITPKYHRPGHPEEAEGVDAPLTLDRAQVGDVEITVDADTGPRNGDPFSPSHPLLFTHGSGSHFTVSLDGAHLPDHDFVLRWALDGDSIRFPVWHAPAESAGTFLATFIPPLPDLSARAIPREFIFVLDRSGSMEGDPIRQAVNAIRACLRSLDPQDTFAILLFDNYCEWLTQAQNVTQSAVETADRQLNQVDARGGTEILQALSSALSLPADAGRSRMIIFLTDGAVSAEAAVLAHVRAQMGSSRVFTFGVGPAVNRAFLKQLAQIGRGQSEFIGLDEDIEDAILRFQDRIAFPLLTNLSLQAEGGHIWDIYPEELPDLYAGCPLEVVGRYTAKGTQPLTLVVHGERMGEPFEMRAALTEVSPDPLLIPRLWAKARTDDLNEKVELGLKPEHASRTEIISLAVEYSLLTKYTAFLAVDQESPSVPGRSYFIKVSQPLPEGLDLNGFTGGVRASAPNMIYGMPAPVADYSNAPAFMRSLRGNNLSKAVVKESYVIPGSKSKSSPQVVEPAVILRELARTQQLNGSWQDDVEYTAAALLAFVRNGHTTLKGHFRKQVSRAAGWLEQSSPANFEVFLRALALRELADVTGSEEFRAVVERLAGTLPPPVGELETAACSVLQNVPVQAKALKGIRKLDDLRLAVVTGTTGLKVPARLLEKDLGRALAACISGQSVK